MYMIIYVIFIIPSFKQITKKIFFNPKLLKILSFFLIFFILQFNKNKKNLTYFNN